MFLPLYWTGKWWRGKPGFLAAFICSPDLGDRENLGLGESGLTSWEDDINRLDSSFKKLFVLFRLQK